ncbi:MAG: hypothetical protein ACQEVA_10735 [Myxococcota bacterium]
MILGLAACKSEQKEPSADEARQILEGQPEIFVERGSHYSLQGMDGIVLGQPKDQALAALEELCPRTMEYRVGKFGGNAWFRGCEFNRPRDGIVSIRVGFWPKLDDRVATLEIKREGLSAPVVSERFRQLVGDVDSEIVRSGFVQMRAETYQMMADWDEGKQGPAHIATGFNPENLDKIEAE